MGKPRNTAPLPLILLPLLCLGLIIGLESAFPLTACAQHQIDPETWIEMRKMFRPKGPAPTTEDDIAALAGADAKRAGPRLIDQGPAALPAVHKALQSPEVELRQAQVLLQVIRDIGDKNSVPVVLEFMKSSKGIQLRRDALLVLAYLPPTEESGDLIIIIGTDESEAWYTRRMAFSWFALHRDHRGRPYAEKLLVDPDPEKRAAGLIVLAHLGDKNVLEPLSGMLTAGPPANYRDGLMRALAQLTTPEEFLRRAPASLEWSHGYKDSLLYTRYMAAGPEGKVPFCRDMVRAQSPGYRELGVRCLLESGHAGDLRPYAAVDLEVPGRAAVLRNEIRKAGWRIIDTDDEFNIVPANSDKVLP
jgi:hypothetical protein